MQTCVIGLGANLGDLEETLRLAIRRLGELFGSAVQASSFYETEPLTLPGEEAGEIPRYLNAAVKFSSSLSPSEILEVLLALERELGRDRSLERKRWQPRNIDLDLLAVGDLLVSLPELKVPHPELANRLFVLQPFEEIWPEWRHPILQQTPAEMRALLESRESLLL